MHTNQGGAGEQLTKRPSFQASKYLSCQNTDFHELLRHPLPHNRESQAWHKLRRQRDLSNRSTFLIEVLLGSYFLVVCLDLKV